MLIYNSAEFPTYPDPPSEKTLLINVSEYAYSSGIEEIMTIDCCGEVIWVPPGKQSFNLYSTMPINLVQGGKEYLVYVAFWLN